MDSEILEKCIEITKQIISDKNAEPFLEPVNSEKQDCLNYYDIISNPMDLTTVMVITKSNVHF